MLERGDKIGDYTLAKFLGRGQFGEVWLAEKDVQFSTRKFQHALKFLFKREDEINLKAVEAEIDTWIEASGHPNVMSVLDMIVHQEYIIIASEYAEGGSLKKWLTDNGGKAPSHEKALEMMAGILSGIEHLHSRNVVHRDLKPDNILLQGKFPRITDFGISRIVSAGSVSTVAMGSPFYMSPESFDGSKATSTDIWSAGVILYEMLTGRHPYHSDTIYGLVNSIRQEAPKPLPNNIPTELQRIVGTALQKDMPKRYPTARAIRTAIENELHSLKARIHTQKSLENLGEVDLSFVTFKDLRVDKDEILSAEAKAKATRKTDVKATQSRQPGELIGSGIPESKSEPASSDSLGWSQETVTALGKFKKPPHADPEVKAAPSASVVSLADSGFGNSQTPPSRRPWLVVAAIGGVLGVSLVAGVFMLFALKSVLYSNPAANANIALANTLPLNTAPKENKPAPPPGMVYVPGGTFTMGRDDGGKDEKPVHEVPVAPFYLDRYEVTNAEYLEFVNAKGHKAPLNWRNSTFRPGEEKFPVVGVSWNDAKAYAEWKGKRLPTEDEWEFAARGEDDRLYPWGNSWDAKNANVQSTALKQVGSFPCNSPFEICDLIGNAWEWTASDFKAYPNGSLSPVYIGKTNLKTLRGGNFMTEIGYATATHRVGLAATGADYTRIGFRCVKEIGNRSE